MVTITDGKKTFQVSVGAFNSIYKSMGFKVATPDRDVGPVKPQTTTPLDDDLDDEDDDDTDDDVGGVNEPDFSGLLELPLSQWSAEELKEFVTAKGIDVGDATKVSQVRKIVKQWLDEQEKHGNS